MIVFQVLIVEDHEDWLTILEDYVRDALKDIFHEAYIIKTAETFSEAYNALEESPWHLVITDIALGDSTEPSQKLGREIVRKAHSKYIPVIAVSGTPIVNTQTVRNLLKQDGASDYFSKSEFNSQDFVTRVQDLLFISQTTDGINESLSQLQKNQHLSPLDAQQKIAQDLAYKAQRDPDFKGKLIKWIQDSGDTATKTAISEIVKKILILSLSLLG